MGLFNDFFNTSHPISTSGARVNSGEALFHWTNLQGQSGILLFNGTEQLEKLTTDEFKETSDQKNDVVILDQC